MTQHSFVISQTDSLLVIRAVIHDSAYTVGVDFLLLLLLIMLYLVINVTKYNIYNDKMNF